MVYSNVAIHKWIKLIILASLLTGNVACGGASPMATKGQDVLFSNERLIKTRHTIELARDLISKSMYSEAIDVLDGEIISIGDAYIGDELMDDTGQKLIISKLEKERGNLAVSANLKLSVLVSRFESYRTALSRGYNLGK